MSEQSKQEESKEENQNTKEYVQSTTETGTLQEHNTISKEQNTISTLGNKSKTKRRSRLKFKLIPKTMKKNQNTNLRVHILPKISSKFFINCNNSKKIVMMVSFIQKRWKQKQDNITKSLKNKGKKVFIYITKTLVILDIQVLVSLFNQTS